MRVYKDTLTGAPWWPVLRTSSNPGNQTSGLWSDSSPAAAAGDLALLCTGDQVLLLAQKGAGPALAGLCCVECLPASPSLGPGPGTPSDTCLPRTQGVLTRGSTGPPPAPVPAPPPTPPLLSAIPHSLAVRGQSCQLVCHTPKVTADGHHTPPPSAQGWLWGTTWHRQACWEPAVTITGLQAGRIHAVGMSTVAPSCGSPQCCIPRCWCGE